MEEETGMERRKEIKKNWTNEDIKKGEEEKKRMSRQVE